LALGVVLAIATSQLRFRRKKTIASGMEYRKIYRQENRLK